ncbi:hypothetical protein Q6325_27765, partial [Klebsiella pneumoniae]|uniref:hypothetical protein n=1 Tax=Klebsiella pneumoniae TaxID=573 RepID=UPI002731DA79
TNLAAAQPFASADSMADAYTNVATKALSLIDGFVKTIKFDTAVDLTPNGFVSSLPATMTGISFNQVLNRTVTLSYPTGTVTIASMPFE